MLYCLVSLEFVELYKLQARDAADIYSMYSAAIDRLSLVHNTPRFASRQRRPFLARHDATCLIRSFSIPARRVGNGLL